MKSKNRIILFVVIGILLAVSIAVFIVTRNKTQAAEGRCKHTNLYVSKDNDVFHYIICNDCERILDWDEHTYENGECVICGNIDPTVCKCGNKKVVRNNEKTHANKCKDCSTESYETHTYRDGRCTVCGNMDPAGCKCGNEDVRLRNESVHSIACRDCKKGRLEAHTYKEGICTVCGNINPTVCKHTNTMVFADDAEEHYRACVDCRTIIYEEHTYKDGVCTICCEHRDNIANGGISVTCKDDGKEHRVAIGDPQALEDAIGTSTTYQQLALSGFPVSYKASGSRSNTIALPAYTGSLATKNLTAITEEAA